jgi:colanic acid biosynthesis glycosyl transferase WcaI
VAVHLPRSVAAPGSASRAVIETLLVVCQVYPPDPAAVGQHVADLAEHMAGLGWRVVVYASARGYDDPSRVYARRERRNGVEVRRLSLSSFGKSSLAWRLIGGGLFLVQAVFWGLFVGPVDRVLVSTSPPFAGIGGVLLSLVKRAPLIWWVMDINPDQMVVAGKARADSIPVKVFDWINRQTLRRASAVVVLDNYMAGRIVAKGPVAGKMHVVPPWPPNDSLGSQTGAGDAFRRAHGLEGKFVVMYSGNHALQHPLDTLLAAARSLAADRSVVFVFIGGGAGKAAVDRAVAEGAGNIVSLPFRPLAEIGESLAAADVHVVTMGDEVVGIVHPSKIYGAMAVGRPILFFGPEASHGGELLAGQSFGRVVRHGDVQGAVQAINHLRATPLAVRQQAGSEAAALIQNGYTRQQQLTTLEAVVRGTQA